MPPSDLKGFVKDEFPLYVPRKGENNVRILPPTWTDAKHYALDIWVHCVGRENLAVLCPHRMQDLACPICEDRIRAETAGYVELVREIRPRRRVLCFLLDRKRPEKGVLAWAMPYTVDRDIARACKNQQTGGYYFVDDPINGYDISFDRVGEGHVGLSLARHPSEVEDKYLDWVEVNPLPAILKWRSLDEIRRLYEGDIPPDGVIGFGPPENRD